MQIGGYKHIYVKNMKDMSTFMRMLMVVPFPFKYLREYIARAEK